MGSGDPHVLAQAVKFAALGAPVMAVGVNKRPRVETWAERQVTAPGVDAVRQEFDRPDAPGLALIMGRLSGEAFGAGYMLGLDIETAISGGRFLDAAKLHLSSTRAVETGGGGRHLYFTTDREVRSRPFYDAETGEHLGDLKGEGGYLIAPPSLHKSGRRYRWLGDGDAPPLHVADFLAWLKPIFLELGWTFKAPRSGPGDDEGQTAIGELLLAECREGVRDDTLTRVMGWARERMQKPEGMSFALLWNQARCVPPLPAEEVIKKVNYWYAHWQEPPRLIVKEHEREPSPKEDFLGPLPPVPEACWRGWFKDYRDVMGPTTEAPDAYHLGCAFAVASMALGRGCWTHYGDAVYPNVYVVLLGPSGVSRKDTALRRARAALEPADPMVAGQNILDTIVSAEGLADQMQSGPVLAMLTEIATLFQAARRQGTSNLIASLTQWFDSPGRVFLPGRGKPTLVQAPFLSLLAATTPQWFDEDMDEGKIRGGFAGRLLYFSGEPKPLLDAPPPPNHEGLLRIRRHLANMTHSIRTAQAVEVTLGPEARDWWATFYRREMEREYVDEVRVLFQRVPLYVRKLAMIYAVLEGFDAISIDHLEAAQSAVRVSQEYVLRHHRLWGASLDYKLCERVLEFVAKKGGRAHTSDIHRRLSGRVPANVFRGALQLLLMVGRLVDEGERWVSLPGGERRNGTS